MVNITTKARANSIGDSKLIDPRNRVVTQLNTFTPVGTAISIVAYMKNSIASSGMPTANIWRPQTRKERIAMRSEEHTSELQSRGHLVCRLLLEKKNKNTTTQ